MSGRERALALRLPKLSPERTILLEWAQLDRVSRYEIFPRATEWQPEGNAPNGDADSRCKSADAHRASEEVHPLARLISEKAHRRAPQGTQFSGWHQIESTSRGVQISSGVERAYLDGNS